MSLENIPAELRPLKAWVAYRLEMKPNQDKPAKMPYYTSGKRRRGTQWSDDDKANLAVFDDAREFLLTGRASYMPEKKLAGVGLAFGPHHGNVAVDLDHCLSREGEIITDSAREVLRVLLDENVITYIDRSPSGDGLHILFKGSFPDFKNKPDGIEIFCTKAYLTMTGDLFEGSGTTLAPMPDALKPILEKYKKRQPAATAAPTAAVRAETKARHERPDVPLDTLEDMLKVVPADSRPDWLRFGIAIGRAYNRSDAAWKVYDEWATRSVTYADDESGNDARMNDMFYKYSQELPANGEPVTLASIISLAFKNGYQESTLKLEHFFAYSPAHNYIYRPLGDFWPVATVNARLRMLVPKGTTPADYLDRRQAVEAMTWHPNEPECIKNRLPFEGGWRTETGTKTYNLYKPPTLIIGDRSKAGPWLKYVRRVYPEDADHIINWLAHRVQFPGIKINHALVLGGEQGIGKDTMLEPVKHGVGPWNWQEISPAAMSGRFNGWVKAVVVRISEVRDLGDVNRYEFYEHSKAFFASPPDVLRCDEKNLREHAVFNVAGYIMTTNHLEGGLFLPPDDRRHYVAWSNELMTAFDEDYWFKFWAWYHAGGIGAVIDYLMNVDLSAFRPKDPPQKTDAWWAVVNSNMDGDASDIGSLFHVDKPAVISLEDVRNRAATAGMEELLELVKNPKNRRRLPHILKESGYVAVANAAAKAGRWKVGTRDVILYARQDLSRNEQLAAIKIYLAGF